MGAAASRLARLVADPTGQGVRPEVQGNAARLHNGWVINAAGEHTPIGDMPGQLVVSPDGMYILVATSGFGPHTVSAYAIGAKPATEPGPDTRFDRRTVGSLTLSSIWRSMRFSRKNPKAVFVSGGPRGCVYELEFDPKGLGLQLVRTFQIPGAGAAKSYPGGLDTLPDGRVLVVDEAADRGTTGKDALFAIDPTSGSVTQVADLSPDAGEIATSPTGDRVYVAEHGTGKVLVLSTADWSRTATISVGSQPNALLADASGRVFCANTGSDTVSVIDATKLEVVHTIRTAPTPDAPLGSIPNSLAVSGNRLYVSNGGNNSVVVIDLGESPVVRGFIPTGWYPMSVAASPKGDWIFVGSGKGLRSSPNGSFANPSLAVRAGQPKGQAYGPNHDLSVTHDYILSTLKGVLSRIPTPTASNLSTMTRIVMANMPYRDAQLNVAAGKTKHSVLPNRVGDKTPIEHVIYIIKENRTYDQVFGDLKQGDGDPNLCLFGEDVTPNHHRLAREFVLLDNTYCDGEVSQDGWEWSTAANDSDWDIKATVFSYGGLGLPPGSRETLRPSNGYIWEHAGEKGLTYYSYGAKTWRGLFSPTWKGNFSQAWNDGRTNGDSDQAKTDIFIRDLKLAEQTGKWPNFVLMSLADDHTSGTTPGTKTPYAFVAGNDLAVGKVVDAVSHSKFWKSTAIFIIEDDAQNGPDHVDSHRTVALVVSPYTKRHTVDHTMYTSSSMVRSIELLFGVAPSSQYSAGAAPMFACFDGRFDARPYDHVVPKADLEAKNTRNAPMAAISAKMDFSDVDLADFDTLNRVLWASCKPGSPYPSPRSGYFASTRARN